jgi:hypothetical protein
MVVFDIVTSDSANLVGHPSDRVFSGDIAVKVGDGGGDMAEGAREENFSGSSALVSTSTGIDVDIGILAGLDGKVQSDSSTASDAQKMKWSRTVEGLGSDKVELGEMGDEGFWEAGRELGLNHDASDEEQASNSNQQSKPSLHFEMLISELRNLSIKELTRR